MAVGEFHSVLDRWSGWLTDYVETDHSNDAWKKYYDLLDEYTRSYEVRADIEVTALAWDRGVEVTLREKIDANKFGREWDEISTGKRNVSTMREFANAILEACDFVDDSNPGWASNRVDLDALWERLEDDDTEE